MPSLPPSKNGLYALVDMGSNGIRLSITHLSDVAHPNSTARSLPTVFQDRLGISLYDAQYPPDDPSGAKVAIPQHIIDEVLLGLRRFKVVCADFGVDDPTCVAVLATEATRTAINSADYRNQIKHATGWEVDLLSKEDEGRIGAMGVASSFDSIEGLVMDLGGGSTQLTYLHTPSLSSTSEPNPQGSISFPYGAAALTQRLAALHHQHPPTPTSPYASSVITTNSGHTALTSSSSGSSSSNSSHRTDSSNHNNTNPSFQTSLQALRSELLTAFRTAFRTQLLLPSSLAMQAAHGGLTLYLSGGGFRGWGFLCLARHKVRPYPIPIINGFTISRREFLSTSEIRDLAALSLSPDSGAHDGSGGAEYIERGAVETLLDSAGAGDEGSSSSAQHHHHKGIFRISKRRARQVPAVAFLVECLVEALPGVIKEVRFCQGGVREGWLFERLPEAVRLQDPLVAATRGLRPLPPLSPTLRQDSDNSNNTVHYAHNDDTATQIPSPEEHIADLLYGSLPPRSDELDRSIPTQLFTRALCQAVANCMYLGNSHPKETRSLNALMLPITGALAGAHGLGHGQRAVLALVLRARWGGDVPEPYGREDSTGGGGSGHNTGLESRLKQLLTPQECWWAEYLGRVAALVGEVYPCGEPPLAHMGSGGSAEKESKGQGEAGDRHYRMNLSAKWTEGLGKKGLSQGVKVKLRGREGDVMMGKEAINDFVEKWEKLGKKKKGWVRGFGVAVRVDVERVGAGETL